MCIIFVPSMDCRRRSRVRRDICTGMLVDMCIDMCVHIRIDMCIDMCVHICMDMCIDMCAACV